MPAMASPLPPSPLVPIFFRATMPRMRPTTPASPTVTKPPRLVHRDAMAKPLVFGACAHCPPGAYAPCCGYWPYWGAPYCGAPYWGPDGGPYCGAPYWGAGGGPYW